MLIRVEFYLRQSAFGPFKRGLLFGRFFKNFSWSIFCTFFENAGFGWPCKNCHNLASRALLEPLFCPKIFSSLCRLSACWLEDNAICARVLLGLSNEGYFLGDFCKIFMGAPLCTFSENAGFGWPCLNCHNGAIRAILEPFFAPKFFPVFALEVHTNLSRLPFVLECFGAFQTRASF